LQATGDGKSVCRHASKTRTRRCHRRAIRPSRVCKWRAPMQPKGIAAPIGVPLPWSSNHTLYVAARGLGDLRRRTNLRNRCSEFLACIGLSRTGRRGHSRRE
jgi:hypothetical protein